MMAYESRSFRHTLLGQKGNSTLTTASWQALCQLEREKQNEPSPLK